MKILKQAEEALRESEQRLATIVAYAPEAMTILDADTGRWVDVNPNAERLFGFDWQSLLSRGPIELSPVKQVGGRSSQEAACGYIEEALNDNAIKYTRAGGVALKVGLQDGRVRFLVEDTGIGIKPEHLTEIFAVFHQVRDPRAAVEGTGLGLAISKRLVRLMGGELQIASSPGEGSHFWFDLDLPPASVPEERVVIGIEGDRRRVFVMDDEENGRNLLRDLLAPLGFPSSYASCRKENSSAWAGPRP